MDKFLLVAIVPMGYADRILSAAQQAGARGGSVLRARGADSMPGKGFFHFGIEPEEDIVLIQGDKALTEAVCQRVNEVFDQEGRRSGAVYILPVLDAEFPLDDAGPETD